MFFDQIKIKRRDISIMRKPFERRHFRKHNTSHFTYGMKIPSCDLQLLKNVSKSMKTVVHREKKHFRTTAVHF